MIEGTPTEEGTYLVRWIDRMGLPMYKVAYFHHEYGMLLIEAATEVTHHLAIDELEKNLWTYIKN